MNVSFSTQIYSHSRDMRFLTDMNVKIDEVMTKENLITAPVGTTHETARDISALAVGQANLLAKENGRD